MRRIFLAIAMLFFFTANQAAMAFEQCESIDCMIGSMDAQKQTEHQKNDPACATHCAIGSHHTIALPHDVTTARAVSTLSPTPIWATGLMPESATLEGPSEPPARA